jgi:anti-sigma factor RsiW
MGHAWAGGHLALDAIVAYVDEELSPGARRRALEHLAGCCECGAEVVAQTQARVALRGSAAPSLPSGLLSSLRTIPQHAELPAPPAGLAVGPDGGFVSVLREPKPPSNRRRGPDRRVRLGAGAVVTGLALGGLMMAGGSPPATASPAVAATIGGAARPAPSTPSPAAPSAAATGVAGAAAAQDSRWHARDGITDTVDATPAPASAGAVAPPAPGMSRLVHHNLH